jgi:hypothetical protein
MRLRAQITLEFDAADYVDAAQHQRMLEEHLQRINGNYPNARLAIRERREREAVASHQQESRILSLAK